MTAVVAIAIAVLANDLEERGLLDIGERASAVWRRGRRAQRSDVSDHDLSATDLDCVRLVLG